MLVRGILGSGLTRGVSFRPFPNSSGSWWLISYVVLIRISCHKTTHANGYYGAWPGWAVSISVLPLTQPVHPKGGRSQAFIGGTDVEAETPILWPPHAESWLIWKDPDAGKDWGPEEKGRTEDEMVGWYHWHNRHGFGWTPGVGDGQGDLACCGTWGRKELDTTQRLNWTETLPVGGGLLVLCSLARSPVVK